MLLFETLKNKGYCSRAVFNKERVARSEYNNNDILANQIE